MRWPYGANFCRPTASVSAIGIASIHAVRTNSSTSGCHIVATNSRQVIVSANGIFSAMRFAAGTPRTSA